MDMEYFTQDVESSEFVPPELWNHLNINDCDVACSYGVSDYYQGLAMVCSHDRLTTFPIASSWVLKSEVAFSSAMAFASALRWDSDLYDKIATDTLHKGW